jgi:hypothetical protein
VTNIRKVLIPYWVEKALKRHNVELSAVLDYSRVKPALSIEDMLSLELLQHLMYCDYLSTYKMEYLTGDLFTCWMDTANEADKLEITNLMSNLQGCSTEPYKYLFKRITAVNVFDEVYPSPNAKNQDYSILDLANNTLGIVIYRGFFDAMMDVAKSTAFISLLVKKHFAYESIAEVTKECCFKPYLKSLCIKQIPVSTA